MPACFSAFLLAFVSFPYFMALILVSYFFFFFQTSLFLVPCVLLLPMSSSLVCFLPFELMRLSDAVSDVMLARMGQRFTGQLPL